MKEIRDKLNRKEKELTTAKDNLHHLHVKYRDIQTKLNNSKRDNGRTEEKCQQLETSLSEITRVKIELFSYLSEATRYYPLFRIFPSPLSLSSPLPSLPRPSFYSLLTRA